MRMAFSIHQNSDLTPPLAVGQCIEGKTTFFQPRGQLHKQPGSLKRVQDNSFLTQDYYHCSCGPEDHTALLPDALTQQQRAKDSRVSEKSRGNSRKRGCLAGFKVTRLYSWPDIVQLSIQHAQHTNAAGQAAHGDGITEDGVRFQYAPGISPQMKEWVRNKLLAGCHTRQIMKEHVRNRLCLCQAML